ncbi:MAG: hypothetical protein ACO4AZ_08110, partial [Ilumatobacteraceae bacterium]
GHQQSGQKNGESEQRVKRPERSSTGRCNITSERSRSDFHYWTAEEIGLKVFFKMILLCHNSESVR